MARIGFTGVLLIGIAFHQASMSGRQRDQTVERTRKNIQVLAGLPESQIFLVMNAIGASLNVGCDHCHVRVLPATPGAATTWAWERDDKPTKLKAREMMRMTMDLNRSRFGADTAVTCYTCHRGRLAPDRLPPLPPHQPDDANPASAALALPSMDEILKRYRTAVDPNNRAPDEPATVILKGTDERTRGRRGTVEIVVKGEDKLWVNITVPDSTGTQVLNGDSAWVERAGTTRLLAAGDVKTLKRRILRYAVIKVPEASSSMTVKGTTTIDGAGAYVVEMPVDEDVYQQFFFDMSTGLLRRDMTITRTILSPLQDQVDYLNYRDVGGVKLPGIVRLSNVAPYDTVTRTFTYIKRNVAVPASLFAPPGSVK